MSYELEVALLFMKPTSTKGLCNSNVMLSTLGIIVGVMVLMLTLAIYDGYVKKMETIIFSFYPQIAVQNISSLLHTGEEGKQKPVSLFDQDEDEERSCERICGGERILTEKKSEDNIFVQSTHVFALSELERIVSKLDAVNEIMVRSPVIFEERRFHYSYITDNKVISKEGNLRVLGVQPGKNGGFVPEIQRIVDHNALLALFETPSGHSNRVILSAALYEKLFGAVPVDSNTIETKMLRLERQDNPVNRTVGIQEIRPIEVQVVSIFRLGVHQIADNMILTGLSTAQELVGIPGYASMLGLSLNDPFGARVVADQIKKLLTEEEITVLHWLLVGEDLFSSLSLYRKLIIVVLLMSIVITAFNIYSNLAILILERRRQIGILLAMGMKRASVYRVFLIMSQIESVLGVMIGVILGIVVGYWFNDFLNNTLAQFLPVQNAQIAVSASTVFGILVCVCFVCGVTSFFSAYKAVRIDAVDALQSE